MTDLAEIIGTVLACLFIAVLLAPVLIFSLGFCRAFWRDIFRG